jgi:hypothetical protein
MSDNNPTEQYTCRKCGYTNIWTRNEILQRGQEVIYRGENEVVYSLSCKGGCGERMRIAITRQEK